MEEGEGWRRKERGGRESREEGERGGRSEREEGEGRGSNQSVTILVQSLTCTYQAGEVGRTLCVATRSCKAAVVVGLPPCGQLLTPVLEQPQENSSGKREEENIIPRSEEGLGMGLGVHLHVFILFTSSFRQPCEHLPKHMGAERQFQGSTHLWERDRGKGRRKRSQL